MLLYPLQISYFEKSVLSLSPSIASWMLGSGVVSLTVYFEECGMRWQLVARGQGGAQVEDKWGDVATSHEACRGL